MVEIICTICPKSCTLQVDPKNDYAVSGNECIRGVAYGKSEVINPTRFVTSTVCVKSAESPRCPVKTSTPVPKALMKDVVDALNGICISLPVRIGQVIVSDVCGTGADIIATRNLN